MKIWASASFTEIAAGKPSSNKKSRWNLWTMQCARPKSPTRSPLCRKSLAGPGCKRLFLPRLRKCRPCLYPLRRDLLCSTRSEEHTSELQSRLHLVCRLLLEKKKNEIKLCTRYNKCHLHVYNVCWYEW